MKKIFDDNANDNALELVSYMAEEFNDAEEIKLVQLLTDGEIRYKMCGKNEK